VVYRQRKNVPHFLGEEEKKGKEKKGDPSPQKGVDQKNNKKKRGRVTLLAQSKPVVYGKGGGKKEEKKPSLPFRGERRKKKIYWGKKGEEG